MAIAVARLFGYRLQKNFNYPYISTSITEFWRRWHISLSSWLRDYLYIPLGGNRQGEMMRQRNLTITMVLGGLWHGASWNFVIWGFLHGAALSVTKFVEESPLGRLVHRLARFTVVAILAVIGSWFLTQLFAFLLWVPFRAQDFSDTLTVLSALTHIRSDEGIRAAAEFSHWVLWLPIAVDTFIVSGWLSQRLKLGELKMNGMAYMVLAGVTVALALIVAPFTVANFIYFQF